MFKCLSLSPVVLSACLATCLAFASAPAHAAPITFTFSGIATGTLAGNAFTDLSFNITVNTDTTTNGFFNGNPNIPRTASLSNVAFTLGAQSGTFSVATNVFNNKNNPLVGFGRFEAADLVSLSSAGLSTYDLNTFFGPVSVFNVPASNSGTPIATSLGNLDFTVLDELTFQANAAAADAPEPASLALLTLVGGVFVARRKKTV